MKLYRKGIVFLTLVLLLGMCTLSSMANYTENDYKINIEKILELNIKSSSNFASRTNDVGRYSSITLDTNNYPHISYNDYGNGDLKYAYWTGSNWNIESVDTAGDVGYTTSLALDSDGYPHISYYDGSNSDLKYAYWNGNSWNIEAVDTAGVVGGYTSLVLDSYGYPHISYYDGSNSDLKYAYWTGSNWNIESVDTLGYVGAYTSLALDFRNFPRISYYDDSNNDLKFASWTGSIWNIETVDASGNVGAHTSLALDSNGYPHISYSGTGYSLSYASWTGSRWNIETVDDLPGSKILGRFTSIALDNNDYPCISYWNLDNGDLKYAFWTGSSWDIAVADSLGVVGHSSSLIIDNISNPHISYFDWGNGNLKYASMNLGGWDIQTVDLAERTDLLDQQNNQWCAWGYGGTLPNYAQAQSFKPSIESLVKFELPMFRRGNPTGLKISIRNDLDGEDLASFYISGNEVISEDTFWYSFDLPDLTVIPDETYYIIWEPDGVDGDNNLYWAFGYNEPYVDGAAWTYDGNWELLTDGDFPDRDFCFKTYGPNDPPNTPTIDGPVEGKAGEEQEYKIKTTDPDGDDVYYFINWGNASEEIWDGPHESGEEITMSHTWVEEGTYTIKVKAKDIHNFQSDYASLEVNMPKNKPINSPFLRFLENHPHLFPLLRQILGL